MGPVAEEIAPPAELSPFEQARAAGRCVRCGAHGAKRVEFMRVMSFIAFTRHSRFESFLCPSCTAKIGSKELAISCALGWWGIPWGLMTLGAIWTNGKSLLGSTFGGRLAAAGILSLVVWGGSELVRGVMDSEFEEATARKKGDWVDDATAEEYRRATEFVDAGQMQAALVPIRRAYDGSPDSAAINSVYGYIELSLGHPDKALPHLQVATSKDAENLDALHMLAAAYLQLGNPAKGADCLKQWLQRAGDDLSVHEQYQNAALAAGRREAVESEYRQRAQREPQSASAQYLLGRVLGEPEEVAPLMRRALELDPKFQSARERLIYALIGQRELAEAETQCASFVPAEPADPTDAMLRAMIAFSGKDFEGALSALDGAIAAGKDGPMLRFQRAQYAGAAQRYEEGRADLLAARDGAQLDPEFQLHASVQEITFLTEEDRFDEASRAVETARKAYGKSGSQAPLELLFEQGLIAWLQGDLAGAAKVFESAPRVDQATISWRTPCVARGMLLALQGDMDGARKDWQDVASAESDGEDWEQVPTAKMLLGQITPEDYLAQVLRSTPTFDNNAHYAVGLAHELAGRREDARASYQAAVETSFGRNHPYGLARAALERVAGH
jgi:Tetratricopeptide repeat